MISKATSWIAARGVAPRTINLETKLLRMILKDARCWLPLAEEYKPQRESRRGPGIALTLDEERKLLGTARQKPDWDAAYLAALVAVNTTMKGCEVKGLHLGDVDLFNRTITVRRVTTKTGADRRLILMNDTALWGAVRLLDRAALLGASDPEHYLLPAFLIAAPSKPPPPPAQDSTPPGQ